MSALCHQSLNSDLLGLKVCHLIEACGLLGCDGVQDILGKKELIRHLCGVHQLQGGEERKGGRKQGGKKEGKKEVN